MDVENGSDDSNKANYENDNDNENDSGEVDGASKLSPRTLANGGTDEDDSVHSNSAKDASETAKSDGGLAAPLHRENLIRNASVAEGSKDSLCDNQDEHEQSRDDTSGE